MSNDADLIGADLIGARLENADPSHTVTLFLAAGSYTISAMLGGDQALPKIKARAGSIISE